MRKEPVGPYTFGEEYTQITEKNRLLELEYNKKKSKENKKDHPKKQPAAAAPDVRAFTAEEITEHIQGFAKHLTMDRHQQWATNYEATLNLMEKENKQEWEILLNKWKERKLELTNKGTKSDA